MSDTPTFEPDPAPREETAPEPPIAALHTHEPMSLGRMLEVIRAEAKSDGVLTVGELLDAFGPRAHGPLLFAPALIAVAPIIGALPGISLTMAALMTLFALQLVLGLERPWAPDALRDAKLPGDGVIKALDLIGPTARAADRVFKPRLRLFAQRPWLRLTGAVALCAALMACVGALLPGLIVPPALVILVLAVGLATEDGLLLLAAYALTAAVAVGGFLLIVNFAVV